ncbi:CHAT domain-containing protein [Streptomyces sp. NPDC053474]|uniref:CHAT domain-containing protein n=1 Tax=Streptomyces sp. NPDC053474 TaxID=3365704 RepID=UPI0037D27B13
MLGLTMLVTWARSMHDRFGPRPPETQGAQGPVVADRAAAGERLRALAALPLAARRDEVARRSPAATTGLLADLFGYGATCEDPRRVPEEAGLLADVLEGIGAALVVGQALPGNGVRRMARMLAAQTHLVRGIAADATGHRAEAHHHFSLAAHPDAAPLDGVAFALGTVGAALTDDGTDRFPAPARDVLGPLEEMCGYELTGLRRALTVRCAAYDVVATVAGGGDPTEGSREAVLKRWPQQWGPDADVELWIAWMAEFARRSAEAEAGDGRGGGDGRGQGQERGQGHGCEQGQERGQGDGRGESDGREQSQVPDDEPFVELIALLLTARLRPEAAKWDEELALVTGGRDLTDVLPTTGNAPAAPPPAHPPLRDGKPFLDPDGGEVAAQLWAAMVAGSPDGAVRLKQLAEEEPGLAATVAKVLGVDLVTRAQREASELIGQGEHHFHRGEYADAATYYQRALDADPESSLALLMLGDVHFVRGEKGLARAYFQESLAVEETPMAWRFLGDTYRDTLDGTEEARRCYARALALDPGCGGARQALEALPPPAVVPAPAPATDEAVATPPAAEPHAPAELEATVRDREPALGELLAAAGDDDRFDAWLRAEGADHWAGALDTLRMTVSQWAAKAGDFERSLLLARRGVQIAEHLDRQWPTGDPEEPGRARLLADALKQAAGVLDAMGRYSEAYDLLRQTERWLVTDEHERERTGRGPWLDHGRCGGLDHWTELYRDLARVARRRGDAAAADEYQRRLDEITADVPDSDHERIVSLVELAVAWHELGERERALSRFHEALRLAEREAPRSPVPIALATVHHSLGVVLGEQGFPRMALHHLAEARGRDSGDADRLAQDWLATAAVLRRHPDLGHAVLAYEQVLHLSGVPGQQGDPLFWASGSEPTATRGWRVLSAERAWPAILPMARAAWEHGEQHTATDVLELGVELADLVCAAEPHPERRGHLQDARAEAYELLTRYRLQRAESEARRTADAEPATDGPHRPDPGHHIAAAFTASERLRARSLLDAMSTAQLRAPDGVPPALLADEAALIAERAALAAAPAVDWKRHDDLTARLDALWRRLAGYGPHAEEYVGVRRATVMDPGAVSRELAGARTVVASYALLDTGEIALFTLGGDGAEGPVRVTPVDADGTAVLRFIGDHLSSAGRVREMAEDTPGLFHRVLDPLVAPLAALTRPEDTVVICPTGALHRVPFHALRPDGSGALIDRNAVAYLPTVSLLRTLTLPRALGSALAGETPFVPVAGTGAVVLGDPGGDLPHARAEALALGERLGCAPLLGEGATRERVLRALPGAEVFHAACHASFAATDPLACGLVLADGVLTARDILRRDWHGVRLAVLSACETGRGRASRTDETLGLSWSLLHAGVRSLVMSLWRVPDATTAALMGDFHDLTAAGEAPGAALRTALLAARDRPGGGRLESWAAFRLLGDWRAPHPGPRTAPRGSAPG